MRQSGLTGLTSLAYSGNYDISLIDQTGDIMDQSQITNRLDESKIILEKTKKLIEEHHKRIRPETRKMARSQTVISITFQIHNPQYSLSNQQFNPQISETATP